MRSRLHPGTSRAPSYGRMAASCATLGCEKISTTSGPFTAYILMASFMISSTRTSSGLCSLLLSTSSLTSSTMQSSMIFPVRKLRTMRRCTSCSGGPPLLVVLSHVACGKVFAKVPDPMSTHSKSSLQYLPMGPGLSFCTESISIVGVCGAT